ncbi:hypothetical protein EMCRGX_G024618 [Ephydatia muelleri]
MELVQDNSLPYVKGKSLCTASFQNKSKPLATVELVCFGPQLFPFLIDPILNMTTRIDMEKAGRKLPNPIFENVVYQQSSAVIHDKVEYGYCEIRGVEDGDLNIKKTAEFLLQQKWVGVVHMSDSSKLYIVPSSDLSQRLGLTDTNYLHGLFARKLPNQADSSVQLSDNLPKKITKARSVLKSLQKIRTTSPRNSSCLSLGGDPQPVAETSHHVDVFANQTVLKSCKKKQNSRTESPLVHGSTVDHVAKPYYGKFSFKKVKTRTEPVFTEQACSTPTNTQSPTMKPNLQNSCRTRMQDTGVTVVGTSVSSCNDSPGILKTSSICGIETQSVGARDAPNTSSVCGTSVSLIGAEDSQNTSSADMSTLSAGVGESGNTSSSTTISLAGIREPLNTIAYASSVGGTVVPALNEGTPGNQLALVTVTGKGGCGGKEKGRGKGAQIETVSLDAEGQGKMLTRKRGKESRNANSTSNSETEPTVKKKKLVGKPAEEGRDVFICVKVLSEVLLKDQVDVIPDILKLEAEVIPILQEELPMTELPMTVSGTSVDNVVSLLSKKPKKSCLSKPRTCSVSRSPSTPTENTVPPMGSGEVTSMVSSTSQKQSFDEGAMGEAATVEDEVTFHLTQLHTETDDILDNGSLTLKTPKKVSLAEYKSRRRPTLDSAVRGKDSIQTSPAMLDTEKECSPKGIMDIMSPVNAGSPRMQLGDNPAHHMFNIAPVSAISVTNHGVAASVFTQAPVSSQTIPFSSTPILPISSAPQDQLLDGARQDAGLAMPQENSEPPSIVLSSLPSSTDSIPSSLPAGSILSGSSIEQTAKLAILQNSQVVPESAVPHIRVSKVQTVSYREDVSKTGSTVPGSSVGTVSNPVPAVAGMSSTGAHVLEATLHTMPPFTLRDLLINQYSDHSTPTSSPCPHPQNEYLLQNPPPFSPVVPPLRDLSSGSNSSQSKSTDHIVDVSLQNFSATGPSTIATQQGGSIVSHKQSVSSRDCSFRRYSSTPPALLPVTTESMLLDPPADLQSPLPMSLVCDSPSFHLVCTSSPQTNSSKVDNTIDVSRSPELALELMLSPSSDHPADSTILAEQQTSSSPFSTPVRSTFPVLSSSTSVPLHKDHSNAVVVNSESTPLRPNVELNTYVPQVSSHQGINDGSSSSTRNAEKSSPKISSTAIPSAHNCPVSIQNSVGGIFRVPYSVCQPSPISQTPAFYLPTCNYYPYVLPCVPPVSSNIPFAYPWTTPYGSVYQHYAVPSTLSSPSPPTQPQAWIVAQHALVSQHLEAQPKQQAKSPKLPKGVAEREQHTGVLLATDVDSSRTSAASLDDQCKSSHKSTQTDHLLDITTSSVVAASDAAVQTVCGMEMGTQTDLGEFFGSVTCSNKSVDEAVWKARQWLIHEIKYNTMDEMETEGDIENSQGSLPSPVISGASNISDGDLMSNSANSDGVSSPSKEDVAISQCFSYNSPESLQRCSPNMRHDPPPLLEFQSHTMGSEAHLPYSTPPYTLYSTPPYTSYSTPPYTSYTTSPYTSYSTPPCPSHTTSQPYPSDSTPPCPPDSTPPPCPSDSTPPSSPAAQYSPYSTPPYLSCPTPPYPSCSISPHASYPTTQVCDSTPSSYPLDLPCPPDSTPPHCPPDSTPPHCPPDSTPPHCLPVSTSPHCLPDSTPPHCLPDSTHPHCLPDCTPPYCLPDCTPPHCLPDSTPPHCLPDSTPPHCLPDATPPHCLPDSTPPHCLPDSTPPHFLPYSTLPHCPPDSTCPCGPPDSTPPHCSHDSLSPHCPHDSTPPHCPLDSSLPHCPLGGSSQPLEPTFVPSSDSTNVAGGSTPVQVFVHSDPFIYCATSVASVAIDSDACHVTAKNSSVNDTSITLGTVCTSHFGSESEENATAKVPCLTGPNESNYSLLCDTLSFQAQSLTEEHVAAQEEQLVNFPSGVNHIRAVSLPPLSSRSSNSSGSPNSSSLFEEEPVFTFSTKLSGRAASLSSSGFGDPPSTGKPKITMSAAEILQKVRAKRSSQPSLPSLQEQQHEQLSIHPSHFPQESPSQENEVDATVGSSSRGEGRGIDLDQLMMKFQNHMKTKQKRKKKDKSWRHISNMDIGSHSLGCAARTVPCHQLLRTAAANLKLLCPVISANPETALPLSSVANPETALPLPSVANPDTALSVPSVVNPETALSMSSVANPETVLSVSSVVNPETALFVSSVANPETALFVSSVANPKTALSVSSVANPETALSVSSVVNPETSLPLSSVANPGLSSVANPETALPMLPVGNNNKNNLKEHLMPTDSHNNIDVQPSVNSLESTSSVQCSEYFAATISIPCYQELPSQEAPSIENMVMYPLSPPASQQLPSVSGVPIISETPVETTHSISEDICICSGDKQQITTEGSIQLNEQCFSSSFDLPCSTNQYVSQHLSSTNQHLPFIHNAGGGGESLGKEKVIMEIEAISDDDGDDTGHSRCTSSHIPAIFDLTNNGKTSPSGLCGNRVMCDDYEHVDMVTSPVGSNSPDNSINALTCNAGINKGFSDIYLAPTHEHSCLSPHNHISDDKECIGNERVPSVEIGRLNKALEAVIEGTDDEARTHIGCMEVAEPTALQVGNRSSTTNTANIKKNDEQFGNAASVSAEQHNDMSNNGIVSEAVASERLGGTVSSKMSIDKPLLMSPNHEPPRDPTLDCIVGNFRSREQGSNACDRNTENFHPYIIDLCEDDSYHPNRERPLNHVSWSEKHSPQRERQQTSPVWRSSAQSQKTGQKVDGMRSSSFQWRGDVNENRPAQCSSNSAGLQPLMNLPLSPDTIPQNGQNIATFLRGTNLPASARASIYNQYSSCTMPPHSMWQLQDLSRRDHVMINQYPGHAHNWQDHPSILQTPEGTSQLPPPLFSAPHHPLMEGRGGVGLVQIEHDIPMCIFWTADFREVLMTAVRTSPLTMHLTLLAIHVVLITVRVDTHVHVSTKGS